MSQLSKPEKRKPKPKKPIKKVGKKTGEWNRFRKIYLKDNTPNDTGYYICAICNIWLRPEEVSLDHIIPRSARPDLRLDPNNIQIACWFCNSEKGSKHD